MAELRDLLHDAGASTLQGIGDALDVGILAVDHQLVVTAWNRWLESSTGKAAADVIGRPLTEVDPTLRPRAVAALEQAVGGSTVILSHRFHGYFMEMAAPSGYECFPRMQQSARVLPVQAAGGAPYGAVALIQDVTERVAREQDLRVAMEEAQSANRAKADFLAAMSHELRTPIGAMNGYADLLADGMFGDVTALQREQLLRIKSVGAHLAAIVEQILTFARIEAGHEEIQLSPVEGSVLMGDAVLAIEPLATKKGLQLNQSFPADPVTFMTDAVKARQILINLMGNAVKFTVTGSISLSLTTPSATSVAFEIADTGAGIRPEDQARIFDPFVQVTSGTTRPHDGTGLGLAVSRSLARQLGGDLSVASVLGEGSMFTLTLPR